jgi:hypothetical protein
MSYLRFQEKHSLRHTMTTSCPIYHYHQQCSPCHSHHTRTLSAKRRYLILSFPQLQLWSTRSSVPLSITPMHPLGTPSPPHCYVSNSFYQGQMTYRLPYPSLLLCTTIPLFFLFMGLLSGTYQYSTNWDWLDYGWILVVNPDAFRSVVDSVV